jgi:hypothetical protein
MKQHAAEEEFQTTCDLIRLCFPEVRQIRAYLQEDPDKDDRFHLIVHITMPPSQRMDLLAAQRRHFSEQMEERLPPAKFPDPVCRLLISFALA